MTGIIDIHAHILPGIDDGSRDWDEKQGECWKSLSRQGNQIYYCDPHYSRRGLNPDIYDLSEKLEEEHEGLHLTFGLGWDRRRIITMD